MKNVIKYLSVSVIFFLFSLLSCDKENENPNIEVIDEISSSIGSEGGTLELKNGVKISIPSGALDAMNTITLNAYRPEDFFDGDLKYHFVIGCQPTGLNFLKDIEILIPVPAELKNKNYDGIGGLIDPESGAVEVYPTSGITIENVSYLKLKTKHFSKYHGYFYESPPVSAPTLQIPHYNQGESQYCWAACIQMLCEGIEHSDWAEINSIIGMTGVDEGGIGQYGFRYRSDIAQMIKDRTGVLPDRKLFTILSTFKLEGYLKDRLALGYPVIVFSPVDEHAFIVVGYNNHTFYLNDPASTTYSGNLCYKARSFSDFQISKMEFNAKFVTLSIPKQINCADRLQTLNITHRGMAFNKVKTPPVSYDFCYDYQKQFGYSFRDGSNIKYDSIPSNVEEIQFKELQIANSSNAQTKTVNVTYEFWGQNNKKIHKVIESQNPIILNPNSMIQYRPKILISEFADPTPKSTDYKLKITLNESSGKILDESVVYFTIGPPEENNPNYTYVKSLNLNATKVFMYNDHYTADLTVSLSGDDFRLIEEKNLNIYKIVNLGVPQISTNVKKTVLLNLKMDNLKINYGPWNPNAIKAIIKKADFLIDGKNTIDLDKNGNWTLPVQYDKNTLLKKIELNVYLDYIKSDGKEAGLNDWHSPLIINFNIDK
ncbi:MAG: C39 family peptidase [Deltaproteobacteria bacterium]